MYMYIINTIHTNIACDRVFGAEFWINDDSFNQNDIHN